MDFKSIIFVFLGGGVGSLIRFIITKYSDKNLISFPLGTSISNLIGCFVIGSLIAYYDKYNIPKKDIYLLVSVGFCGGLTTFSTFILDIFHMLKNENLLTLLSYFSVNFILGFLFICLGILIFKWFKFF